MADIDKALADLQSAVDRLDDDSDRITPEEMKEMISSTITDTIEDSQKKAEVSTYRTTTEKPKPVTIVDISDNVLSKLSKVMSQFAYVNDQPTEINVEATTVDESFFGKIFRWVKDGMLKIVGWISDLVGWAFEQIISAVTQVGKFIMMKMFASMAISSAGRLTGGGPAGKFRKAAAITGLLAAGSVTALIASGKGDELLSKFAPGWGKVTEGLEGMQKEVEEKLSDPEAFIISNIEDSPADIEPIDPAKMSDTTSKDDLQVDGLAGSAPSPPPGGSSDTDEDEEGESSSPVEVEGTDGIFAQERDNTTGVEVPASTFDPSQALIAPIESDTSEPAILHSPLLPVSDEEVDQSLASGDEDQINNVLYKTGRFKKPEDEDLNELRTSFDKFIEDKQATEPIPASDSPSVIIIPGEEPAETNQSITNITGGSPGMIPPRDTPPTFNVKIPSDGSSPKISSAPSGSSGSSGSSSPPSGSSPSPGPRWPPADVTNAEFPAWLEEQKKSNWNLPAEGVEKTSPSGASVPTLKINLPTSSTGSSSGSISPPPTATSSPSSSISLPTTTGTPSSSATSKAISPPLPPTVNLNPVVQELLIQKKALTTVLSNPPKPPIIYNNVNEIEVENYITSIESVRESIPG
jgi:hypothetical protein